MIANLAACAFSIYFMHLIIVEILQSDENKIYTQNEAVLAILLIGFSLLSFLINWAVIAYLNKHKTLLEFIFVT